MTTLGLVLFLVAAAGVAIAVGRGLRTSALRAVWVRGAPATGPGADSRQWALERIVTNHLDARHPTPALAEHLLGLAERRASLRLGVRTRSDPGLAAELLTERLGAETLTLLTTRPPPRMDLHRIDDVVRRIEEL